MLASFLTSENVFIYTHTYVYKYKLYMTIDLKKMESLVSLGIKIS